MSTTLHAFFNYTSDGDIITYADDKDFDYSSKPWLKIYNFLGYCGQLTGNTVQIPIYDTCEDAYDAQLIGLSLIDPEAFVINLTAGVNSLKSLQLNGNINKDTLVNIWIKDGRDTHDGWENDFIDYGEDLLEKAKDGRYFVWNKR